MSGLIDPNNLENYPDHTAELENLESKDVVDFVVPNHIGTEEQGRVCLSFFLVAGETAKAFALNGDQGSYSFEPVYEFTCENEVDSYGEIWNRHALFRWEDRIEAERAKKTANLYARRFTLGEKIPEDEIQELVEEGMWSEERRQPPECVCDQHSTRQKEVSSLNLTVDVCANCERPYRLILDEGSASLYRSALELDWVEGTFGSGTSPIEKDDLRFYKVDHNEEPKAIDATLHGLTRESHIEFHNFGYYRGVEETGLLVGDPSIGKHGVVVGYLLWNQPGDISRPCLQQVYTRPSHRGNGYGQAVLDLWLDEIVDEDRYYAIDVSETGMEFLRRTEQITENHDCPAIPVEVWSSWDTDGGKEVGETAAAEELRRQGY